VELSPESWATLAWIWTWYGHAAHAWAALVDDLATRRWRCNCNYEEGYFPPGALLYRKLDYAPMRAPPAWDWNLWQRIRADSIDGAAVRFDVESNTIRAGKYRIVDLVVWSEDDPRKRSFAQEIEVRLEARLEAATAFTPTESDGGAPGGGRANPSVKSPLLTKNDWQKAYDEWVTAGPVPTTKKDLEWAEEQGISRRAVRRLRKDSRIEVLHKRGPRKTKPRQP
jgi:hypothetical protein